MASNSSESGEQQAATTKIQIYPTANSGISSFWKDKYEKDAKKYWDIFYKRHQDKFFKDRHYLDKEWGRHFNGPGGKVLLEVGCGAGNTIFPLRATYPDVFVHACDFSQRAISLVKSHKEYSETSVNAFVCDLTNDDLSKQIPSSSVDIVTMIFVLSAVSPEKMSLALQNIRKTLKERFTCKDQKISENFYVRGDGTRAFYFSEEYLAHLFEDNGFVTEEIGLCCKQVENRSRELVMNRRWIQGVFCVASMENDFDLSKSTPDRGSTEIEVKETATEVPLTVEFDLSEGLAAQMFGVSPSNDEVIDISFGDLNFKIKVLSKENQHTCRSTGLMLWESARLMASILVENPSITAGRRVLELGCGCSGICSMIAAQSAHLVVATDADASTLDLLTQNVSENLKSTQLDKLLVRTLHWGNQEHIDAIKKENDRGFDVIIGTDVTYISEAILPLFSTAAKLLSVDGASGVRSEPALILCHVLRRVDEPSILSAASQFGFRLVDRWPCSSPSRVQSIMTSWLSKIDSKDKIPSTALSILYFQRVKSDSDSQN
uniref:Methyltransferase type 12 domain-containing protein n=1 Tax=Chenopodium quinoa TaxID=63459 RepID=A0A803N1Y8_CHEQI